MSANGRSAGSLENKIAVMRSKGEEQLKINEEIWLKAIFLIGQFPLALLFISM